MKKIVFIGGAVMKTPARQLLFEVLNDVEILCLNGGALFHDFQMALEGYTSVPLEELNISTRRIEESCEYLVKWLSGINRTPVASIVKKCEEKDIEVLLFTAPGCDYWQMFMKEWDDLGWGMGKHFNILRDRFKYAPFHFINICSAVIGPEIMQKAIQGVPTSHIKADVVDFLELYRPRTRVAKYGTYYKMEVSEYMRLWKDDLTMKEIPLTQNKVALVDDEDFEELSKYKWRAAERQNTWYAVRRTPKGSYIMMHREILKPIKGFEPDHINGNGLDNKRCNLRPATRSQNLAGASTKISNTSGFTGVSWDSRRKKWKAKLMFCYYDVFGGRFDTKEEAALKYNELAKKYFGEFAKLNVV